MLTRRTGTGAGQPGCRPEQREVFLGGQQCHRASVLGDVPDGAAAIYLAAFWPHQPRADLQQRRLARAVGAHDCRHLAGTYGQVHVLEHDPPPVSLSDLGQHQHLWAPDGKTVVLLVVGHVLKRVEQVPGIGMRRSEQQVRVLTCIDRMAEGVFGEILRPRLFHAQLDERLLEDQLPGAAHRPPPDGRVWLGARPGMGTTLTPTTSSMLSRNCCHRVVSRSSTV